MLVLTRRPHETIVFPAFQTTVHVVSAQPHSVRLGVEAPAEVRVLTGEAAERGVRPTAEPSDFDAPSLVQLDQLVQKRLDIARLGLTAMRRRLDCGQEDDVEIIRKKIDEDLHMLQRRIRREVEKAAPRTALIRRIEIHAGPQLPR
ncbi:MAG TPA: carbon storage regulator [Gemmataceae bacterium]|nr:carbon storage regulator [Gemmataceae bacterium]